MRRTTGIILTGLFVITLFIGCANKTVENANSISKEEAGSEQIVEKPEVESISPNDLFYETYNVFSGLKFPENYHVYAVEYEKQDCGGEENWYNVYRLFMIAEDTDENVINFISNLLGDDQEKSIQQNLDYLQKDNFVGIDGTQIDDGMAVICEIKRTTEDAEDYEYSEGYEVQLMMRLFGEECDKYDELLLSNMNYNSLSDISNYIDIQSYISGSINVNTYNDNVNMHYGYSLDNAQDVWDELTVGLSDYYLEEWQVISINYGDLETSVRNDIRDNNEDGWIHVFQKLNSTEICLQDYSPEPEESAEITLKSLGFEDYREESAKCTRNDSEGWVLISRSEWGENPYTGERDAVLFAQDTSDGAYMVFFYPDREIYHVILENGDRQVEYEYSIKDNQYTDGMGGYDVGEAKDMAELVFNKPGTDSILQDAWVTFDQYIKENFDMDAYDLFELNYE